LQAVADKVAAAQLVFLAALGQEATLVQQIIMVFLLALLALLHQRVVRVLVQVVVELLALLELQQEQAEMVFQVAVVDHILVAHYPQLVVTVVMV
jgi:hypothetical protein